MTKTTFKGGPELYTETERVCGTFPMQYVAVMSCKRWMPECKQALCLVSSCWHAWGCKGVNMGAHTMLVTLLHCIVSFQMPAFSNSSKPLSVLSESLVSLVKSSKCCALGALKALQ